MKIKDIQIKYSSSRFAGLTFGQKCLAVWCALSLCGMCAEVDLSRPDWWLQILLVLNFGASSWCCAKWVPLGEEGEE